MKKRDKSLRETNLTTKSIMEHELLKASRKTRIGNIDIYLDKNLCYWAKFIRRYKQNISNRKV